LKLFDATLNSFRRILCPFRDHAYSDPKNEIIGHLGGQFDPETRIVHATIFSAGRRVVTELSPTSVEGDPEDIHEAQTQFDKKGIKYVGWYHSHPKIVPTPSSKDATMQAEMQQQVPFAFGLICSPFMERSHQVETYYFNAFRVSLDGPMPALLKVAFSINKSRIPASINVANTIESNKKHLKEAEQTFQAALPKLVKPPPTSSSSSSALAALEDKTTTLSDTEKYDLMHAANLKQQYAAFLSHFTNSGISGVR
jgi:proteasome lid subunit RPN8/RPN11